ncbi:hypothetical protein PybrP1_004903 [[Pythium] brassicae (nom. inval.)]|nr:hypothetical protein PybrP1_004903 [[Pythium] brassicae (nom. inval.)]
MAPLMDSGALKHEGPAAVLASLLTAAATAVVAPLPYASVAAREAAEAAEEAGDNDGDDVLADAQTRGVLELPAVVLELVCAFVDHATLHAVEHTCNALYDVVQQSAMASECSAPWKKMTCLAARRPDASAKLLRGVEDFSSADRPSETPANTLTPSSCWTEIQPYLESQALQSANDLHDLSPFGMTLGERIQHKCGCSSGNSCYWSSSASSDKNAAEHIDYNLVAPCVVSCVQLLPYRVFWHPGSPTYAPEKLEIEFYDAHALRRAPCSAQTPAACCFYKSPVFSVANDMRLQSFELPRKVVVRGPVVMRLRLLGRHQAQTFELPPWLQRTPEDRLPKYYCCISYVTALGHTCAPAALKSRELVAPLKEQSLRMANSLAEYMSSCYEGLLDMRRRGQ